MSDKLDFWSNTKKERPKWLNDYSYLTVMGSRAYGSATEDSDWDFYGFTVPPIEVVFPHLTGDIPQFGRQKKNFNQLQLQAIQSEKYGEVDLTIYNITRYFQLVMDCNPNMIDSLFVPIECIIDLDRVGSLVRNYRHLFLSQKLWHTFKGMAFSHMRRITSRTREGKRKDYVEEYGYDVKDASHVIRLMLEMDDFLFLNGTVEINKYAEEILSVRNGEWTLPQIETFFDLQLSQTEERLSNGECKLPKYPDENKIKDLLVFCLEEKYGSLSKIGWNTYN